MIKKPDYCPEWFDIDLYDKLSFASRDELMMHLWLRQINHRHILGEPDIDPSDATDEKNYQYNRDWLIAIATECLQAPLKGSPDIENYNPFEITDVNEIIREADFRDVTNLYLGCYLRFPLMREMFQQLPKELDSCVKQGITSWDWVRAEDLLPENISKERIDLFEREFDKLVDADLGYSTMVHIALHHSDELIIEAFKKQLAAIRERDKQSAKRFAPKDKRVSDSEISRIVEYRIFAYIDLYLWSLLQEKPFTNNEMAAMIYPVKDGLPPNFDAVDRVARTVKPKALDLLKMRPFLFL